MAKQMVFEDDCRQPLLAGVSKLARAVKSTLGPGSTMTTNAVVARQVEPVQRPHDAHDPVPVFQLRRHSLVGASVIEARVHDDDGRPGSLVKGPCLRPVRGNRREQQGAE